MTIIQIVCIGVLGTMLALQFKNGRSEYGIYLSIAISLIIFFGMGGYLQTIVDTIDTISNFVKVDSDYITAILKMLGVTYLAEFAGLL